MDVVALGELLIDFTPYTGPHGSLFEKNPGGAPANVLAALAKQGKKTAFIGKVGEDHFGHYLEDILRQNGISTEGLVFSETENTTLAFVELDESGDRSFTFYRKPGADYMLSWEEVNQDLIRSARIFHYGSISMTHEPAASATLAAVRLAKEHGLLISYDPNLRLRLWPDPETAKARIREGLPYADVLKLSEEEMEFLTDERDLNAGTARIHNEFGISLICVTRGPAGCFYRAGALTGEVPAYAVDVVDTTGAGDAFLGGVLGRLLDETTNLQQLTAEQYKEIIAYGNATGSLAATSRGGIPSMPSPEQVMNLICKN
ncbi:sugar kinase [Paenibacillus swuensis]|uniref:Sugar kinase n=1 Tax=Paenibacillus swuensis TaxID=1178515 RepID=A0A172TEQ3_9BACL|nr:PfkB family carbohydrate kinase [Paenibacillus swuensis]ANE45529.1 sugar kinase [Paenibacillus swuensis]